MKKNVWQIPKSSPFLQRSLVLDSGHLLVQVPKRSGIQWKRIAHKEFGITSRTRCCWNSQRADVLFFRATTPFSSCNLKSKGHGKLSIHFTADYPTIETVFSHNCFCQLKEEIAAEPRAPLVSSPSQFPPTCVGCGDGGSPSQARHSRGRVECPEFGPRREVEGG